MGLVIIDHWAQKSVSDRFVFFLGIILLLAVGNTPFAFILGTSALPCHDGMKIHRRHRQRKNEFLPLGRQSHWVGYLRRNEMRGATLPYMLFRILLVSSDEMPLRPSKRNNGTCDYRPLGTEECERSLCFFLGHYTSTCCRQYSFLFLNSLQYVEMDAINVYAATKIFFIALFRGFACFFFKYAGFSCRFSSLQKIWCMIIPAL